ncbi:sensor histidine kinase [Nitrospirillum viridazoti Y2]|uniref:Signal transduction histidine-protein kinase/phosphatase MprB n=1 Tax=Nitrospirillum amazonense TaxID=28077 RepID=A0A560HLU3_9PROT|nr:ATP-binding protein [Nitrospirillum amazonense]EGY02640.1 sensor histidine kinase [Nitrospirillum amazonense Y2]TWB46284.1 two-component system OmpR family sensor kinase [Nitrospirillum amazonense]
MKTGLFWKLLLAFWVAFFTITELVWVTVNLFGPPILGDDIVAQREAPVVLGALAAALKRAGLPAALEVLEALPPAERPRVEILPATVQPAQRGASDAVVERQARGPDGADYRLRFHYRTGGLLMKVMPSSPMILALFGGPIFGAVLAWYLLAPIRRLRQGFDRIAAGDLSVRLAPGMGGRHDEIADLARDFDVMAERLQQSIHARERLLHDVSHELRSPLSRLQLAIGLARQDPARVPGSLDRIEYEGRRLDSVVRELLSLARAESGHAPGDDYFDLTGVLESVLADARFEAEAIGVRIVSGLDSSVASEEAPNLHGNAELTRWALDNVVRNALRFSTRGQSVQVRHAYDDATRRFEIEVADEGPGAPSSLLPNLFEPFVRADRASPGFGLGLAVAKRAVLAQGGKIEAANRPAGGLVVRISLPVSRPLDSDPDGTSETGLARSVSSGRPPP